MIIDLLSTDNYVSYNIQLAHLIGLEHAIYLSELIRVNAKAIRKSKLTNGYITVDRDYIFNRTTLKPDRQQELDGDLAKLGILEIEFNNRCMLILHIEVITTLLLDDSEELKADISKVVKKKANKKTKDEAIKDALKENIITDNQELRQAYYDWIDSVFAKQGWMSKKAVLTAQNEIDKFTNRNLDLALKLLEIASISGYRDITWAINSYNKNYNVSYKIANQPTYKPDKAEVNMNEVF